MAAIISIVFNADRKLRFLWRAVIFYAAGTWLVFPLLDWPMTRLADLLHTGDGLTAGNIAVGEFRNLLTALICTGAFALHERRRVDSYGLPVDRALSLQTFEGAAAGVVLAGAVALGMFALDGMRIVGLANNGGALAIAALEWFGATLLVGIAEEFSIGPICSRRSGGALAFGRLPS